MRFTLIAFGAVALLILGLFEIGLAYPVPWYVYLVVAVAFGGALIRPMRARRQIPGLAVFLGVTGIIAALYFVEWTSRKPFLRDLRRVRVGMSEAEARQIMRRYMEGTGWPTSPWDDAQAGSTPAAEENRSKAPVSPTRELVLRDSIVFRHSNDGAFNSDWGIISLSDGKVVKVEFSAD